MPLLGFSATSLVVNVRCESWQKYQSRDAGPLSAHHRARLPTTCLPYGDVDLGPRAEAVSAESPHSEVTPPLGEVNQCLERKAALRERTYRSPSAVNEAVRTEAGRLDLHDVACVFQPRAGGEPRVLLACLRVLVPRRRARCQRWPAT